MSTEENKQTPKFTPGPAAGAAQATAQASAAQTDIKTGAADASLLPTATSDVNDKTGGEQSNSGEGSVDTKIDPAAQAPVKEEEKEAVKDHTATNLTSEVAELQSLGNLGFKYAGFTDVLDEYVDTMNGNRIPWDMGSYQQKQLLNCFKLLLTIQNEYFQDAVKYVMEKFIANVGEGKCFDEYKRAAFLFHPTNPKANATFPSKTDYALFTNMVSLFSSVSDIKSRKEVLQRIDLTQVLSPVKDNRQLNVGVERFLEFFHVQH